VQNTPNEGQNPKTAKIPKRKQNRGAPPKRVKIKGRFRTILEKRGETVFSTGGPNRQFSIAKFTVTTVE
jgi:hypothetical protein